MGYRILILYLFALVIAIEVAAEYATVFRDATESTRGLGALWLVTVVAAIAWIPAVLGSWLVGVILPLVPVGLVSGLLDNLGIDYDPLAHFLPGDRSDGFIDRINKLTDSIEQSLGSGKGSLAIRLIYWVLTLRWVRG